MVIELPFELDTIDAIGEAETTNEKLIAILSRVGPFFLHLLCAVMEYMSYVFLKEKVEERIVCTKYFEITEAGNVFLILDYICVIPDLMFAVLGPISIFMIYNNPYVSASTVCFNGLAGLLNLIGAIYYLIVAGLCGNPEQGLIFLAPLFGCLCGIFHIGLAILAHMSFMYLDKEGEIYFGRFDDFLEGMKQN